MSHTTSLLKLALNGLYHSGMYHLFRKRFSGRGVLLTLHHVTPQQQDAPFSPNRILNISPEFLDAVIALARDLNIDIVSLDEFRRRLVRGGNGRRFVSFTLDDGYADNYLHAWPIFRKHKVPFTVYLCSGLMHGRLHLWWQHLENTIRDRDHVEMTVGGQRFERVTGTTAQKAQAFDEIYWALRRAPLEQQEGALQLLRERYPEHDQGSPTDNRPLTWAMVREMHDSGLLTVGAHTESHRALSKLAAADVSREFEQNVDDIEKNAGVRPAHAAYPYGDAASAGPREFDVAARLGFATAVTTRKGVVFAEHADHLHALPRVSLNGDYQRLKYVKLFLSGLPFALSNRFRRVNVD
ncbi:MAG: polysaccharide deacetylase family protein [Gammaproteobacteria bacterium]|nr:polysaccharide deacetylase family protein [Gammaproteobacteria bacterium]